MDTLIEGLETYSLKRFDDERGSVLKFVSKESPFYEDIGEVYFSKVFNGVVKGWKKHHRIKQHLVVPHGEVKFVIFDDRENSPTYRNIKEVSIGGLGNYQILIIPNLVYYAFQGIGPESASLIGNYTREVHDPKESEILDLKSELIPYSNWDKA